MGNYGDPFTGLSIPPVGTAGPTYASRINAILTEVMVRLSQTVSTSSVAPANADLDMNFNYAVQNQLYSSFATALTTPSGPPFGRFQRYNGNIYWVDSSGSVQITAGGQLNAAGIGGIGGDYGSSNPARLNFVDSPVGVYEFYDDPTIGDFAGIKADFVEVTGIGSFETHIESRASIDYNFSLPASLPGVGSRRLLSVDSTGNVEHDQTINYSPTFSADVILSGASRLVHGDRTLQWPARWSFHIVTSGPVTVGAESISGDTGDVLDFPLIVQEGWRIKGVSAVCSQAGGGNTVVALFKKAGGSATSTSVVSQSDSTVGSKTVTATATEVVSVGDSYFLRFSFPSSGTLATLKLTYDIV